MKSNKITLNIIFLITMGLAFSQGPLHLPFYDDFSQNEFDQNKWETYKNCWLNNSLPQNQPSVGVVSFDGADSIGQPYSFYTYTPTFSLSHKAITDQLISKKIDLSTYKNNNKDSVFFIFYWQKGGVETKYFPESTKGESLNLYFLDRNNKWQIVWPLTKDTSDTYKESMTNFKKQVINIKDSSLFFHSNFQFKFENYGKDTGPRNQWSIDYIQFDSKIDTNGIQDFAFTSTPTSLLKNYTCMPIDQFRENAINELRDTLFTYVSNLSKNKNLITPKISNVSENQKNTNPFEIFSTNSKIEGNFFINPNESRKISLTVDKNEIINEVNKSKYNNFQINLLTTIKATLPNDINKSNDSITSNTTFRNYLSYDDGIAEAGIGYREYGFMAYEFNLTKDDTIKAIDISFLKEGYDVSFSPIMLKIWKSLEGVDGKTVNEVLYQKSDVVQYSDKKNGFTRFLIEETIKFPKGKIYVGFESANPNPEKIYIGLDKNNNAMDKVYYNPYNTGNWTQFTETNYGAPMIRLVFEEVISGTEEIAKNQETQLYPNPATNHLYLKETCKELTIYNIEGQLINTYNNVNSINIADLEKGLYIIKYKIDNQLFIEKFIKE